MSLQGGVAGTAAAIGIGLGGGLLAERTHTPALGITTGLLISFLPGLGSTAGCALAQPDEPPYP